MSLSKYKVKHTRAVAKEGMVKQNTSGKAVERLIDDIKFGTGLEVICI
ncbi:MAG: hypothetical protein ACI8UG_002239 [Gammaproteobacteria bacterium]|jgi:hypothetical protein